MTLYTVNGEAPLEPLTIEDMPRVMPLPWDVDPFDVGSLVGWFDFHYPDMSNRERAGIMAIDPKTYRNLLAGNQGLNLRTYYRLLWELEQPVGAFMRGVFDKHNGLHI